MSRGRRRTQHRGERARSWGWGDRRKSGTSICCFLCITCYTDWSASRNIFFNFRTRNDAFVQEQQIFHRFLVSAVSCELERLQRLAVLISVFYFHFCSWYLRKSSPGNLDFCFGLREICSWKTWLEWMPGVAGLWIKYCAIRFYLRTRKVRRLWQMLKCFSKRRKESFLNVFILKAFSVTLKSARNGLSRVNSRICSIPCLRKRWLVINRSWSNWQPLLLLYHCSWLGIVAYDPVRYPSFF